MRLPIEDGIDRDEYPSHGHSSEPGWCKPAWHGEGEWTREPRSESRRTSDRWAVGGDGRPPLARPAHRSDQRTRACEARTNRSEPWVAPRKKPPSLSDGGFVAPREKTDADHARQPGPDPQPRAGGRHADA